MSSIPLNVCVCWAPWVFHTGGVRIHPYCVSDSKRERALSINLLPRFGVQGSCDFSRPPFGHFLNFHERRIQHMLISACQYGAQCHLINLLDVFLFNIVKR
ncbi:MAG: hypothetical protein ACRD4Q_11675, partial [Candidatus Acidiferrales bacterium]